MGMRVDGVQRSNFDSLRTHTTRAHTHRPPPTAACRRPQEEEGDGETGEMRERAGIDRRMYEYVYHNQGRNGESQHLQ